jgi:hypothetical protein
MLLKQPTSKPKRRKLRVPRSGFPSLAYPRPPAYVPSPESLKPHPRCFRSDCRAVKKDARSPCVLCGSLATSSAPLVSYTIYIEEF